jgi:hypothetical protein
MCLSLQADCCFVAEGRKGLAWYRTTEIEEDSIYTTTWLDQAQDWAESRASEENFASVIVRLTLDRLELRRLNSLAFVRGARGAQDFWSFVSHCRQKNQGARATHQYYDVVYGPVAKDWKGPRTAKVFRDFDQISFHGIDPQNLLRDPHKCKVEILT